MSTRTLPETPQERLRWALREGLVIAGVLLFWLGVAAVLTGVLSLLGVVLAMSGLRGFHLVSDLLRRAEFLWPAFSAVAFATGGLYVVVRAGTLLIDHYRQTAS